MAPSLFAYAVVGCLGVPLGGLGPVGAAGVRAAHESAEIMVYPTQQSWGAFGDAPGGETEVADLCQFLPAFRVQAGWLPMLFDRSTETCRAGLDR